MRHSTFNTLPGQDKGAGRYFDPTWVVNLCFVVVMVCSTVLTWREVIVLENAYATSQRSALENVSNALDMQMQVGVERLLFFRHTMQAALQTPLELNILRKRHGEFDIKRALPQWQIGRDNPRTLPVYGVSDYFVAQTDLLTRDNPNLHNELTAAMELGYLFRLSSHAQMLPRNAWYVSRAGFFVTTNTQADEQAILPAYYRLLMRPWFAGQRLRENRGRGVRWFSDTTPGSEHEGFVTASVPLDYQGYWLGVLGVSFPIEALHDQLLHANPDTKQDEKGDYLLYDSHLKLLTSTSPFENAQHAFDGEERARLSAEMQHDTLGGLRLGARYVSWQKLKHFGGVLVRIHTLREGITGDFGRISIAMAILWVLFMTMLLVAWGVIRRMVKNMYAMQNTLQWQAWYDPLTRLCNRGVLFERAKTLSQLARTQNLPFAVIQLDLDHFKEINDRFGHQAGDLVLSHTAGLISSSLDEQQVAGRVGGEEFCILLPGRTLGEAAEIAERIRQRIASKEILIHKHTTIRISASLGVSEASESESYDFEYLQSIADRRLYRAKHNGRDQVCAEDEVPNS
ncbi:cellulose biosynthesis regulator diguanylate cyclase DgcQ [Kosakonia cowanii]|uniref:cellulose biosynthesis regulator diguanylate cyclase DgcQ n=1 Tax=Kosakonia cowanii TaxID=208223 RepID=UPI0023F6EB84|nr:cellulose biosynthesis regulator diguanylate cyclase DgcQ [Kosakonia cowanii]MDF7760099.1 cellulose biosynthesis regulator diguanylate cyclase DgcQ [Kosakonia cowanii]